MNRYSAGLVIVFVLIDSLNCASDQIGLSLILYSGPTNSPPTTPTTRCEQEEVDESGSHNIDEHGEVQEGDIEMGSPEVGAAETFNIDHIQPYIAK